MSSLSHHFPNSDHTVTYYDLIQLIAEIWPYGLLFSPPPPQLQVAFSEAWSIASFLQKWPSLQSLPAEPRNGSWLVMDLSWDVGLFQPKTFKVPVMVIYIKSILGTDYASAAKIIGSPFTVFIGMFCVCVTLHQKDRKDVLLHWDGIDAFAGI